MHRRILVGIITAVVCGLFVSAQTAQAGAVMTSVSRVQSGGDDHWTFYYDTNVSVGALTYWVDAVNLGAPSQGSDHFTITVASGTYGWDNNAIYVYGGTNSLPSYVVFHPDGSSSIHNQ